MSSGVLVVGASHAGVAVAVGLRDLGYDGTITMVGAEARLPYERPPLSKQYLLGTAGDGDILLRSPGFYEQARIEMVGSELISEIDLDGGSARSASREFAFQHLALATGASPRELRVPGSDLPGVLYLRTAADAERLGARLRTATAVAIVGGGYIGLEAAAVIRQLGKQVTVIETAPTLIPRASRPELSTFLAALHRVNGVSIELGAAVEGFEGGSSGVRRALLSDGRTLDADLVLVGIGIIPNIELAQAMGLDVDGGVVVDSAATTSDPRVVAAGDVTAIRSSVAAATGLVRLESVHNATAQGSAAARTILGVDPTDHETPWFWSNQYDVRIQMAGLHRPGLRPVVRGDITTHSFSVLYVTDDCRLQAIDCVNRPRDFLAGRRAIDLGHTVSLDIAADATVPLRDSMR